MTYFLLISALAVSTCLGLAAHAATARYGLSPVVFVIAALLSALNAVGSTPIIIEAFGDSVVLSAFVLLPVVLMLPLVIYEVDGTVAARITILGVLGFSCLILAVEYMREVFAALPAAATPTDAASQGNWRINAGSTAGLLVAYVGIPILHQSIRNLWRGASPAFVAGVSLLVALWIDELVFRAVAFGFERLASDFIGSLPEKTAAGLIIWPILGIYLTRVAPGLEDRVERNERGPLDVLLGHYSDSAAVLRLKERQRQEAESALAVSRKRFQHTFSEVRVGLVHADTDGRIQLANPYFLELLGYEPDEMAGKSFFEISHPDDRQRSEEVFASLAAGQATRFEEDARILHKGGTAIWVHVTGAGVPSSTGGLQFMVLAVEDLTLRRETEAQLRQAQKMEAVGQLTGGVAHDFNNLLMVVMSGIELALRDEHLDEPRRRALEGSLSAADRGARLTNQLLSFSRRQSLNPEETDIAAMLGEMRQLLDRVLGETIDISLAVDTDVGMSVVDRTQLESALLNLALNARDAMPDGGSLRFSARRTRLDDEEAGTLDVDAGPYVEISVEDQGAGMTEDNLERAIEPFFSTKEPGKGTGLGLSMVYGFATQSGGALQLSSTEGGGTTATILLPMATQPSNRSAVTRSESDSVPDAPTCRTVLLVEDEPRVRVVVVRMLEELGYSVVAADSAAPALEILEGETEVDLLFTDVVLPGNKNGFELGQAARDIRPGLPVLFTSGYRRPGIDAAVDLPQEELVLKKPYRRADLAAAMCGALQAARRQSG